MRENWIRTAGVSAAIFAHATAGLAMSPARQMVKPLDAPSPVEMSRQVPFDAATGVDPAVAAPPKAAVVDPLPLPPAKPAPVEKAAQSAPAPALLTGGMTQAQFLDRLMMAESGGRDNIGNPRSTALGAYQFIIATWLEVMQRHFASATAAMSIPQILALRTDRSWSRRAAEAYTNDNAVHLAAQGLPVTYPNLRLAFLLGPQGAAKILKSVPNAPVVSVLGPAVVQANPFMSGTTAASLIARSARDVGASGAKAAPLSPGEIPYAAGLATEVDPRPLARAKPRRPVVDVRCNMDLPSCRRWFVLAERRALKTLGIAAQDTKSVVGRRPTVTR
jgi:hypothetical protein